MSERVGRARKMIAKQHIDSNRRLILAICDDGLLGQVIEDKDRLLDLSADFYKGENMEEKAILKLISCAYMINAVGKESVACCIKAGACDEGDVLKIKKTPYLQIVKF